MNRTTKLAKETELIRFFVKPIGLDPNGNNFIHRAASLGHIKLLKNIVKEIERFCPDPDFLAQILNIKNGNGETALHLAIKKA
jgi:ankyrin repeat protein